MSTTLTKKNIVVGTDNQIQARYTNDPAGTIYLSTTAPQYPVSDVKTSTDGTIYNTVLDGTVAKIDLSPYLTTHQTMLYRPVNVNGTEVLTNISSNALNLIAGSNVTISSDSSGVTIASTGGSSNVTIDATAGSENISDNLNTINVMTRDTAQQITGTKTFLDKTLKLKPSSSATTSTYRPSMEFDNYSGSEVGSVQFHTSNNQLVFGTNEQNQSGIQLALRAYNSSNAYSAKLPLTTNKAAAIGSGDVNLPLAVKVGSDTAVTANSGGVIELPAPVEANPTVPSGTTPTSLTGLKVGNDYYEVSGGGGSVTLYHHTIKAYLTNGNNYWVFEIDSTDSTPFTTSTLDTWFTTHAYGATSTSTIQNGDACPITAFNFSNSLRTNFLFKAADNGQYYSSPNMGPNVEGTGFYGWYQVYDAVRSI